MILQFRKFILSSLGFLFFVFVGQPLWTVLHGALAKLPLQTRLRQAATERVSDHAPKRGLSTRHSYGTLPIYFEPNLGQTDSQVKFIARGNGATTFLTATEAVFSLPIADFGLPNGKQSIKRVGYGDPAVWEQPPFGPSALGTSLLSIHPRALDQIRKLHSIVLNRQSQIANRQSQ